MNSSFTDPPTYSQEILQGFSPFLETMLGELHSPFTHPPTHPPTHRRSSRGFLLSSSACWVNYTGC